MVDEQTKEDGAGCIANILHVSTLLKRPMTAFSRILRLFSAISDLLYAAFGLRRRFIYKLANID